MRSSNKRSRSKSNRPKTLGNIVNRVFDSSGPEGKVRGTPQQIIEKYQVLARDAQLSNDRVAAENFQQHAEHYTRMLAQAQREMQAEQDARRQHQDDRARNQPEDRRPQQGEERGQNGGRRHDQRNGADQDNRQGAGDSVRENAAQDAFSVHDFAESDSGSGTLVETPESASGHAPERSDTPQGDADGAPKPRPANRRKPRAPKPQDGAEPAAQQSAEQEPKPARRAPRKPRKPAADSSDQPSTSAAE